MTKAALVPVGPRATRRGPRSTSMIAAQAPGHPVRSGTRRALVQSKNVYGVANSYTTTHDLNYTFIK